MLAPSEKVQVMNSIFGKGKGQASTSTKSEFIVDLNCRNGMDHGARRQT